MLEVIPDTEQMVDLVGKSLFEIWKELSTLIDEKYDMDCLWDKDGKAWTYEYKYRRGGKTLFALYNSIKTKYLLKKSGRYFFIQRKEKNLSSINEIKSKFIIENKQIKEIKTENNSNNTLIEIEKLMRFRKGQPFSMYDNTKKEEMKNSIKENGILVPIIIRKIEEDKYEILSGHNRVECAKELGFSTIPSQIVDCDEDKATLIMLDTNLNNREKILPVEKGYAYKQRNEILKNRGNISNNNSFSNHYTKWNEEGKSQIYNYIRLTELIKQLQEKVNIEQIPIKAGVELSYLIKEEQEIVNQAIEDEQIKITVVQAQKIRLKKNQINYELVLKILKNEKIKVEKFTGKIEKRAYKIYKDKFKNDKEFTDLILDLLDKYFSSEKVS